MRFSLQKIRGVSLLEAMFVMILAVGFLLLGMRQYRIYKNDLEMENIKSNVVQMFEAMVQFYRANCQTTFSAQSAFGYSMPVRVLYSDLQNYFPRIMPSSLVDTTVGDQGYYMQFNPASGYAATQGVPVQIPTNAAPNTTVGYAQPWSIQISVAMANTTKMPSYVAWSGADCASAVAPMAWTVSPCNVPPGVPNKFLAWQRMPSVGGQAHFFSNYWISLPLVRRFNQGYTTYPILVVTGGSSSTQQFFKCGG